jgi:DNA-binding response OmpR family regulator
MSKILLVEDDATMRILLKTLLELDGHHVDMVLDPKMDIVQYAVDLRPEIMIMDVHLRSKNGIDILKSIRQLSSPWHPFILMASGMDVRDECLQAGADGFLLKPYMPDELSKQLKKAQST